MAPRLELFPFRYRDPLSGKWIRARCRAELHEIAARYTEFEIIGPPEIRDVDPEVRHFTPYADAARRPVKDPPKDPRPGPERDPPDDEPPVKEPPDEDPPKLDGLERFLLLVFLRRYVTYCARHRRFAAITGRRGCTPN